MTFDRADFYETELRRHDAHFRAALRIAPRDRVLDIGCGAGLSTREAARAAVAGRVVGVDLSGDMLRIARRRSAEEGLRNISFELGDAQVQAFSAAQFDLCISRFGAMFFADPVAAFGNIGQAMRPGARLVLMVWQSRERNEWATAIHSALASGEVPSTNASPAFSLGDRAVTTRILQAAGFVSIDFADVHEPVFYGPNIDAAQDAVVELFLGKDVIVGTTTAAEDTLQRLRRLLEAHLTPDGVFFDSRSWLVTARRSSQVPA